MVKHPRKLLCQQLDFLHVTPFHVTAGLTGYDISKKGDKEDNDMSNPHQIDSPLATVLF